MQWQTWFRHDDGTPRVLYLTLHEKNELVLSETIDGVELDIRLETGTVQHKKTFCRPDGDINSPETQAWAKSKAAEYLDDLSSLANAAAETIRAQCPAVAGPGADAP